MALHQFKFDELARDLIDSTPETTRPLVSISAIVDRAKEQLKRGLQERGEKDCDVSDRDLSETLGLGPTAVSNWRVGRAYPSEETIIKLATVARVPVDVALLDLVLSRAKDRNVKAMWAAIRLKIVGACVALSIGGVSSTVNATATDGHNVGPAVYYRKLRNRWIIKARAAFLPSGKSFCATLAMRWFNAATRGGRIERLHFATGPRTLGPYSLTRAGTPVR